MADKSPESDAPKAIAGTSQKSVPEDFLLGFPSPEKTDETGYGSASAPHGSDFLSGAEATSESAVWTSDDHGTEEKNQPESTSVFRKLQVKKGAKKPTFSKGSPSTSEATADESIDKPLKLKFRKRSTSGGKSVEASSETREGSTQSRSTEMAEGEISPTKESGLEKRIPKEGIISKLSKFISPRRKSSEGNLLSPESRQVSLETEAPSSLQVESSLVTTVKSSGSTKLEKSLKSSPSPLKKKLLSKLGISKSKSPVKQEEASSHGESSGATAQKPTKIKTKLFGRAKSPVKPGATSALQSQQTSGAKSHQTRSKTVTMVRKGVANVELAEKRKMYGRRDERILAEESMDVSDSQEPESSKGGTKPQREQQQVALASERRKTVWRPQNKVQEGGYLQDDLRTTYPSSYDDITTEISTVSDASGFQGGSESKGKTGSMDTLSRVPLIEEELAHGASEPEQVHTRRLQRQKRTQSSESSGSDEEARAYREICGSPLKKAHTPTQGGASKQ